MRISSLFSIFLPLVFFTACGLNAPTHKQDIKVYKLYMNTDDEQILEEFRSLVDMFNYKSGFTAISFTTEHSEANSIVILSDGLEERDGKVGWGQWKRQTYHEPGVPGVSQSQRNVYTMNLEFDKDYYLDRMHSEYDFRRRQLFTLFAHEVGHGLTMPHDSKKSSVMYPDISGTKEFDPFFERVREFFGVSLDET